MGSLMPVVESPVAAANAAAASFAALEAKLDYLEPADVELVRRAYRFADTAHLGQLRHSGEPYITHPIAVAAQVAEWNADRSLDMKKAFYKAIAEGLHARLGVRHEDVFISLVEVPKENWSFGNGVAQYAP